MIENRFSQLTKGFDAYLVIRIYAPVNGTAQTDAGPAQNRSGGLVNQWLSPEGIKTAAALI